MAPALTAEPLSSKEKLTSTASPATGTRQSVRKLESPSGGGGGGSATSDTTKKPTVAGATTPGSGSTTTRVTRSKDAAKRTVSPSVQTTVATTNNHNNKRKSNNNNNLHNNNNSRSYSEVLPASNDQMGLSAATTHTSSSSNDGSAAAATNSSGGGNVASDATVDATVVAAEHNNNCKELLANLTSDFEEAISAEICLRKTLPEVSLSKEQPATTAAVTASDSMSVSMAAEETQAQSTSGTVAAAAAPVTEASTLPPPSPSTSSNHTPTADATVAEAPQQQIAFDPVDNTSLRLEDAADAPDNIEARLSQLDGSPIVDISASSLEASVALPLQQEPVQQESVQQESLQQQPVQQPPLQQPDLLASPQHSVARQTGALLTPQSTSSSINFLKDGAAGAVLEDQDIEEVLKALKTLDGTHVNPDTICDFNFFNEVCFLNNEEEAAAAAAAVAGVATAAASGVVGGECNLPVPSMEVEEKPSCSNSGNINASLKRPWQESHAELEEQQHVLERKMDFMLRRIRKFQTRQMCHHASAEVAGILEWSARSSHKAAPSAPVRSAKLTEQEDTVLSIVSGRPGVGFWEDLIKHPLPASQMSNVMRHIETAARKQQICHTIGGGSASLASSSSWYSNAAQPGKRSRKLQQANDAIVSSSSSGAVGGAVNADGIVMPRADEIVPNFDNYVTSELTHVAGLLYTEMREVQHAIDSDATESSSGGESADEMVNYNNTQQLSLPISRRAVWRYTRDRAAIALRWTWLCAQVADLEMKIRQHNDVYNDLYRSKGDVLLESTPAPKKGDNELQSTTGDLAEQSATEPQPDWLCSRTRPLMLSEFRKRKLFQTINMHTISKKAARPSNIKCGCQWPQVPCTLCTGRPDPTAPRDLPETLMPQNRVALLDASYHPVLSFPDDVCQSVHLEAISRQPDWQYRVMRSQAKAVVKSMMKAEREALALSGGGGGAAGSGRRTGDATVKRRYVRRKERNNNNNSSRNNTNNSNNNNNNSNINNNNSSSSSKETSTTTTAAAIAQQSGGGGNIVGLDSGNGTGTATTSSSSTPTTTPLVANTAAAANKRQHRQLARTSGNGSLNSPLPDPKQHQQNHQYNQQQQHNPSLISSGNGAKKSRKSVSKRQQQRQQQQSANNINNRHNNCSGDDSHWDQQQHSRRNSAEIHGHRNERTSERRRLVYDIDNIVIPYSMAAQTRVEILPYKEIPTPKWRIVDKNNKSNQQNAADETLSNGCIEGQKEQTKTLPETSTESATSTTNSPAATSATTSSTISLTTSASTTTSSDTKEQNEAIAKPVAGKVNGLKQASKKNSLTATGEKPLEQPLTNGLVNGNASKPTEDAMLKPATPVNGKIKKHGHKSSKKDTKEPPSKRPKLQLKEKNKTEAVAKLPSAAAATNANDEEEIEDTSDEAYIVRHQLAMLEEKRLYEAYLNFPGNSRSRANRRADSRAESSGANTPDPASPAASLLAGVSAAAGADNESVPSPLAQTMLYNPLDSINADGETGTGTGTKLTKRQERRRTTSHKLKEPDRRSATPDAREFPREPPPFEPLVFPLSEETYQRLLTELRAEPKEQKLSTSFSSTTTSKRAKSKSVSSNGGDGNSSTASGSRRSSKAKASKLSKTTTRSLMTQRLNGVKNAKRQNATRLNGGKEQLQQQGDYDDARDDFDPEDDDEEEEEEDELLLEEDDDYHYLAPPPEDEPLPKSVNDDSNLYDASIDAYLGEHDVLDDELADDPFVDDDPNDPEWKRSIGARHERMRKRV
ncbi:platelet binding protein GspB isoform X1 [Drosophila albomicans]|uniref:Platelet binding protein GspB isoform X1 n=1 Tax=Drosophila albomicans TaxID=7291 RepID=A0A9C6TAC1_DROAB|nr:platelet binding protein GspB isoform X1 [Drosophila albomicans]XP_051864187.1 platelet binding protein GspB isoform X1 [Drosophila albomicans]